MRTACCIAWLACCVLGPSLQAAKPADDVAQGKTEMAGAITQIEFTEDARELLVLQDEGKALTVLGTASGEKIKDLAFSTPVRVGLCRGEQIFLIQKGKDQLLVLSRKDGWKESAKIPCGSDDVDALYAPGG